MRISHFGSNLSCPGFVPAAFCAPESTATKVREWLERIDVKTLYIEPGSPWEIGYVESFNGKLRDELLEREIFDTLGEAKVLIERRRREYNTVRPTVRSATTPLLLQHPECSRIGQQERYGG